jgi:hypothetical protein
MPKVKKARKTRSSEFAKEGAPPPPSITKSLCWGRNGLVYVTREGAHLPEDSWPKGLVLKLLEHLDQEGRVKAYEDIRNRAISHGILSPDEAT